MIRLPEEPDMPFGINLVPMIDVMFSILTFFILSTIFLTPSEGFDVNLPQATTSQPQQQSALKVGINAQGDLSFQGQAIALDQLSQAIQQQQKNTSSSLVVIQADENVTHGRVVHVMDKLRQIPGVKLAIATISDHQ